MHRFFIAPDLVTEMDVSLALPGELAHQVRDVLHLNPGEQLILLDNRGDEILAVVESSGRAGVGVRLLERHTGQAPLPVRLVLCQALLKSARFEWILEKGTELGVTAFAPIFYQRSTAGLAEVGQAKIRRWQRIIQEATEQCGRAILPELLPIRPLATALAEMPSNALAIMPWEETGAEGYTLHEVLEERDLSSTEVTGPRTILLFIGPEGGLTSAEIELARRYGTHIITLGPRILRSETAALASIANVLFALKL